MKNYFLLIAAAAMTALTAGANEYTFVFDGDNSLGGIPRQTDEKNLEYVDGFSLSEEGIDFTISKANGTGSGFALINAGGDNAGIYVSSKIGTTIELTVPRGSITFAKIKMTGYALNALDLAFNGKDVSSTMDGAKYNWEWSDKTGAETLIIEWPSTYMARYIHSIELTYTADLNGKKECGLSFSKKNAEAVIGEKFTAPSLKNPNRLPVSWSSSDPNIATIDSDGAITLVNGGTTTITASTEGNDEYAPGNAKYVLSVIPMAHSIAELKELAPNVYDRVKVDFPATVTFANANYAYVIDNEDNAGCICDTRYNNSTSEIPTIYQIGNVIPSGWIATNSTIYENVIWDGQPDNVTKNVEVIYPYVSSVSPEDANRVVILKNVTFESSTASGNTKAYGTTPDNTRYEFQDTYNAPSKPAGTYDVTCIVMYSKVKSTVYFYLIPISYSEAGSKVDTVDSSNVDGCYFDLSGQKISNPKNGMYVKVMKDKTAKVVVK